VVGNLDSAFREAGATTEVCRERACKGGQGQKGKTSTKRGDGKVRRFVVIAGGYKFSPQGSLGRADVEQLTTLRDTENPNTSGVHSGGGVQIFLLGANSPLSRVIAGSEGGTK